MDKNIKPRFAIAKLKRDKIWDVVPETANLGIAKNSIEFKPPILTLTLNEQPACYPIVVANGAVPKKPNKANEICLKVEPKANEVTFIAVYY